MAPCAAESLSQTLCYAKRYNVDMFFRRQRPVELTFQDRLDNLKRAGFSVAPRPDGTVLVSKGECAVALRESGGQIRRADLAGILMGSEIGSLGPGPRRAHRRW